MNLPPTPDETPSEWQHFVDHQRLLDIQQQQQVQLRKEQGFDRLPPEQRYQKDPEFHHLVDMLELLIERAQLTPSEIREAATLACIHYENRMSKNYIMRVSDASFYTPRKRPDCEEIRQEPL